MAELHTIKIILTVISGLCWTIVYIEGIRLGLRDRSYAIPFFPLALNLAWELLHTFFGFRDGGGLQATINAIWFLFDLGIVYTYVRFGRKYFPRSLPGRWFIMWSALVLATAFAIEYAFIRELGVFRGGAYAAFLQNLLMSVLFIQMLVARGSREGQSLLLAVSKWIGTLAPTIQFGVIGDLGFQHGSVLVVVAGGFCSVFDLIYIWVLSRTGVADSPR
ncbi:MAG TPA: hypothetical protein VLA93_22300 [Pyrinomonadaceae bacterium]|nr:hypothetical protein [Pyrinomonadaceae bacterium]